MLLFSSFPVTLNPFLFDTEEQSVRSPQALGFLTALYFKSRKGESWCVSSRYFLMDTRREHLRFLLTSTCGIGPPSYSSRSEEEKGVPRGRKKRETPEKNEAPELNSKAVYCLLLPSEAGSF